MPKVLQTFAGVENIDMTVLLVFHVEHGSLLDCCFLSQRHCSVNSFIYVNFLCKWSHVDVSWFTCESL